MNLVPKEFVGEVIGPHEQVRVIGRPRPFQQAIIDKWLPAGLTVDELLDAAMGERRSNFSMDYYVCLDGDPIPSEWRSRVRVKSGTVTFAPRLHKSAFRSIALIALAVLALVVAPLAAGALFAAGTTAFTVAQAVIGAGIVLAGSMAVNALFPVATPVSASTEEASGRPLSSISGASNTADPFGPVPAVYGRMRVWPRYAAAPYVEYVGRDQYLRLLFCLGYGPLAIDELKIGETDVADFDDVDVEIFEGYDSDTDPTIYPGQVFQDQLSVELNELEWNERTTADQIDVIQVDINLPNGYYDVNENTGKFEEHRLGIAIEYRAVGNVTWLTLASYSRDVRYKRPTTIGFTLNVSRDQYEVRVRKTTGDTVLPNTVLDAVWISLKGLRNEKPITFHKPLALVAMRIKASGQLNNVIDTFNCMVESRGTSYNGSIWVDDTESRNPADIFRLILQGAAIYRPVPDEQIDLDSLQDWWDYCDDEGWEYNREHSTQTSVLEALRMVCAAGRARVVRTDGKWGVIYDEADVPVAQHFTPRNSWGFEESRVYVDRPHALRVNFINAAKGYVQDERRVYDDGYTSANATKFEAIEFPGVTSSANVWRMGRFQMAQYQLRPSTYSLMTNWQALSCTIGSRVYCAHDVTLWGLAQGRVTSVVGDVITLDQEVTFELGTEYQIRFRQPDGTSVLRDVTLPEAIGATHTITLDASALPDPVVGDLVMFGEDVNGPAVLLRVLEIEWMPDLRVRVTLVDDAPEIADADSGTIPEFESQITAPAGLFVRAPTGLAVREIIYVRDNAAYADAAVSWQALAIDVVNFEVQMRDEGAEGPEFETVEVVDANTLSVRIEDLEPGTYSFRVRSLFKNGAFSDWASLTFVDFTGTLSRPDDVQNFRISVLGDTATLTWDAIFAQAVAYYVLRYSPVTSGAAWGSASILLDRITGTSVQVPAINGTFLIKAFTLAATESLDPATIIYTGQALITLNVVEAVIPEPDWFGVLTDLSVDTNRLFLDADDAEGTYLYGDFIELGETFTSRVSPSITAFGDDPANVMASWETLLSVDNLSGAEAADWQVLLEERHLVEALAIDTSLGSNIGDMTANGGLAAAFDGDNDETTADSAQKTAATSAYVGKTLASSAAISHAVFYGSSDGGLTSADVPLVVNLRGKQGTAPANAADGTLLGTANPEGVDNTGAPYLVASDDPTTMWDHVWIEFISPSANLRCAELELYEATADGWTEWRELRLSDITARAFEFRLTVTSLNPAIDVYVEEADISVDMPDRIEALGDLNVLAAGSDITFTTPFRFLETVVVTAIQNAGSGDYAIITNRSETGFTIQVKDSTNTGVARIVDAMAAGYGRQIS